MSKGIPMNIRRWHVWVHPWRDDMVIHRPQGSSGEAESIHVDGFIKRAAVRGFARIMLEQKGLQS